MLSGVPRTLQLASATHRPDLEGGYMNVSIVTTTWDCGVPGIIMLLNLGVLDDGRAVGIRRHGATPPRQEIKGFVTRTGAREADRWCPAGSVWEKHPGSRGREQGPVVGYTAKIMKEFHWSFPGGQDQGACARPVSGSPGDQALGVPAACVWEVEASGKH